MKASLLEVDLKIKATLPLSVQTQVIIIRQKMEV
jgi:hypothetical protein